MYYGWSMEFLEAGKRRLAQVLSVLFPLHSGTGPFWRTAERELLGLQDRGGDIERKSGPPKLNTVLAALVRGLIVKPKEVSGLVSEFELSRAT